MLSLRRAAWMIASHRVAATARRSPYHRPRCAEYGLAGAVGGAPGKLENVSSCGRTRPIDGNDQSPFWSKSDPIGGRGGGNRVYGMSRHGSVQLRARELDHFGPFFRL